MDPKVFQTIFEKLSTWAPAVVALFSAFDDPEEAVKQLRSFELQKRREGDQRLERLRR